MGTQIQFTTPENWKRIKPERYKDFSILDNEQTPCEFGYAVENEKTNGYDVVSIFNYGQTAPTFFTELKSQLDIFAVNNEGVEELNQYIKDNADGYAVTKTNSIRPIYYKKGKLFERQCFISIMQIGTNVGASYSLQIFMEVGGNTYCFTTATQFIDEKDPIESIVSLNPFIDDLVSIVIKSVH